MTGWTNFRVAAFLAFALSPLSYGQSLPPSSLETIFDEMEQVDLKSRNEVAARGRALASEWLRSDVATMRSFMPILLDGLRSSDRGVRVSASAFFSGLGMFRADDALAITEGFQEKIVEAFDTEDDQIRANLMRCFANARPEPPSIAISGFAESVAGPDSEPRRVALVGLMRAVGSDAAAAAVIKRIDWAADHPDRMRAFLGLAAQAKPGHQSILRRLETLLDQEEDSIVVDVISVFSAIGAPAKAQLPALDRIAVNGDRSDFVRDAAREAGARIRSEVTRQE